MSMSRTVSTSQLRKNSLIPALAIFGSLAASIAALLLIPRLRDAKSSMARGLSEPVIRHSPFDIEYPPAP